MKPNKKQRYLIYKDAFDLIIQHYSEGCFPCFGLCFFLKKSIYSSLYTNPYHNLAAYPEIYECRPLGYKKNSYFFPSNCEENLLKRLVILDRAIILTNPKPH